MTIVACATAAATLAGQISSGDRALVAPFPGGTLVAVVDGLGHGHEAGEAAAAAVRVLAADPAASLGELLTRCHEELRRTRGAVMTLASFRAAESQMTWLAVGNVEGMLVRAQPTARSEAVPMRGGTVGYVLPTMQARAVHVDPGDTLVLATDGIRAGFRDEVARPRSPQEIADRILDGYGKRSDDACVLVARYVGEADAPTKIAIDDEPDVAHARIRTRELAHGFGLGRVDAEALASAVSELARNIIVHAEHGELEISATAQGVLVVVRDRGPGIADVDLALRDGYSTKRGLGLGLPAARRLVDELEVETVLGTGTVVTLKKWLR